MQRDLQSRQGVEAGRDGLARLDQVAEEPLVDMEVALVLSAVAEVVGVRQNPPDLRPEAQRVRQDLEDDVPIYRSVAPP